MCGNSNHNKPAKNSDPKKRKVNSETFSSTFSINYMSVNYVSVRVRNLI